MESADELIGSTFGDEDLELGSPRRIDVVEAVRRSDSPDDR